MNSSTIYCAILEFFLFVTLNCYFDVRSISYKSISLQYCYPIQAFEFV